MTHTSPLWQPAAPESSQTSLFRDYVNSTFGLSLCSYQDLYQWSIEHRSDFWNAVWEYEDVIGSKQTGPVVDESATPRDNPEWFAGARLNWAENQLRHAQTHPDDIAIIQTSEPCSAWSPEPKKVTQRELLQLVGSVQRSLDKAGVGRGDRVAWYGGNCLEAVVVLLATSTVGGVFSSAAADFGVDGVVERLEQVSITKGRID
jgi:acetoacetyl-CoA synthetase